MVSKPTKRRFVAKRTSVGHQNLWGVYDTKRGSWPCALPGIKNIPQHLETEMQARKWADKLEEHFSTLA